MYCVYCVPVYCVLFEVGEEALVVIAIVKGMTQPRSHR